MTLVDILKSSRFHQTQLLSEVLEVFGQLGVAENVYDIFFHVIICAMELLPRKNVCQLFSI